MKKSINNGVEIYFEYLKECNKEYNKLINISCIKEPLKLKKSYFNIIQNLNKVIPWYYNKKTDESKLASNDGILYYKNIFPNFKEDLNIIFNKHINIIDSVRNIRNGIEHSPHQVVITEMSSGCNLSFIEIVRADVLSNKYIIKSNDLKKLIEELDALYKKLLKTIKKDKEKYFGNNLDSYTFKYLNNYKFCKLR